MEPSDLVAALERHERPLAGAGERFGGYSVSGLQFATGDVLALRRFPATSGGLAYTSVWHRTRDGRWTFYTDLGGDRGCTQYFSPVISELVVTPIRVEWLSARHLAVSIQGGRLLHWSIYLASSIGSQVVSATARLVPERAWDTHWVVPTVEAVLGLALRSGRVRLTGRTPSGHGFRWKPAAVWHAGASRARLSSRDLGGVVPLDPPVALGDVWLPRRGLFVAGEIEMSKPDRRSTAPTQAYGT